jgi:hypothetical protein
VIDRLIDIREAERPQQVNQQTYAALLDLFKRSYEALDPIFAELAQITNLDK